MTLIPIKIKGWRMIPTNMETISHLTYSQSLSIFECSFCRQTTTLDFYRFSHPDMICYLKRLQKRYEEARKTLDIFYILFNKI